LLLVKKRCDLLPYLQRDSVGYCGRHSFEHNGVTARTSLGGEIVAPLQLGKSRQLSASPWIAAESTPRPHALLSSLCCAAYTEVTSNWYLDTRSLVLLGFHTAAVILRRLRTAQRSPLSARFINGDKVTFAFPHNIPSTLKGKGRRHDCPRESDQGERSSDNSILADDIISICDFGSFFFCYRLSFRS